jgi:hypothetical protein
MDGATLPSAFTVQFDATDNRTVGTVDLYANGAKIMSLPELPWNFSVAAGAVPAGVVELKGIASDPMGNQTATPPIHVTVKKVGESPGDLGRSCTADTDCNGGGSCFHMGSAAVCTRICSATSACPAGFSCVTDTDYKQRCLTAHSDSGCSAIVGARHAGVAGILVGLAVALGAFSTRGRARRRARRAPPRPLA